MATLFSERFFLFLGKRVQSTKKQLFRQIFAQIIFLIKLFLIRTFNPQEVFKKWTGRHITEEREPKTHTENDQILSLHKSLASFFTKKTYLGPSFGSHYSESPISLLPTALVQTLTVTHSLTNSPVGLMNNFQSNWYSTIKTARYYLLRMICYLC